MEEGTEYPDSPNDDELPLDYDRLRTDIAKQLKEYDEDPNETLEKELKIKTINYLKTVEEEDWQETSDLYTMRCWYCKHNRDLLDRGCNSDQQYCCRCGQPEKDHHDEYTKDWTCETIQADYIEDRMGVMTIYREHHGPY